MQVKQNEINNILQHGSSKVKPSRSCQAVTIAEAQNQDYKAQSLDLIRMLAKNPWIALTSHNRWIRTQRTDPELETDADQTDPKITQDSDEDISTSYDNGDLSFDTGKRSALATALNAGRRRRRPTPALGKAVTPYVGVGMLNDVGSFFNTLRDNLETLASLSPQQQTTLFHEPPHVLQAASTDMSGGGSGMRRLHALRPLKPTANIRSYNRRSFVEADGGYPGANHHDPGLLWTGLGRR
ncbi:unnamed protein product [Parnassius apollo]|uniref:(apollo) hypothetical protein n=1 Tax=Parnassius apollo TaxID=110799 RepID=A0A8S3XX83_PARAO|nr:unnamed protein product [Parnassius apollo]